MNRNRLVLIASSFLCVCFILFWLFWKVQNAPEQLLQKAHKEYLQKNYPEAQQIAAQLIEHQEYTIPATMLAAEAAEAQGKFAEAVVYYNRIPDSEKREAIKARGKAGELLLLKLKVLSPAEKEFRELLKLDPQNSFANEYLAYLLGLSSQSWAAEPYRLALIPSKQFTPLILYLLSMGDRSFENNQTVLDYSKVSPQDPLILLGLARGSIEKQQFKEAEAQLRQAIKLDPDLVEAYVKLGQLIRQKNDSLAMNTWMDQLPEAANEHPMIWNIRGNWYQQQGKC